MKKVCEDCTHNNYCGGEYVDEKGCFYKHYYNKDGKYVMSAEEKEEKEMGIKFDHYIKNVGTINIEFLPDDSQVKLQVRSGEDIHLFLLEGKGVKIVADRYTELKAENFRLHEEQDKLLENIELLKKRKDMLIKNYSLEEKRLEESDISLQQALKEINELKDLNAKLKQDNYELAIKMQNQNTEIDKLKKRNKELNKQIDEMVLNANKREAAGKEDQSYSLDGVVKALDKALDGFSERMDKLCKEFADIFCEGELEVTTEETYEIKEADEEPHSRSDILRCAEKCVCGQREQDYGTPESNFKLIADLWNDYLGLAENGDGVPIFSIKNISPMDVAMMMALLKIARIRNGGGTGDSFVDLAGYAACGGEINAQKKATETN